MLRAWEARGAGGRGGMLGGCLQAVGGGHGGGGGNGGEKDWWEGGWGSQAELRGFLGEMLGRIPGGKGVLGGSGNGRHRHGDEEQEELRGKLREILEGGLVG